MGWESKLEMIKWRWKWWRVWNKKKKERSQEEEGWWRRKGLLKILVGIDITSFSLPRLLPCSRSQYCPAAFCHQMIPDEKKLHEAFISFRMRDKILRMGARNADSWKRSEQKCDVKGEKRKCITCRFSFDAFINDDDDVNESVSSDNSVLVRRTNSHSLFPPTDNILIYLYTVANEATGTCRDESQDTWSNNNIVICFNHVLNLEN